MGVSRCGLQAGILLSWLCGSVFGRQGRRDLRQPDVPIQRCCVCQQQKGKYESVTQRRRFKGFHEFFFFLFLEFLLDKKLTLLLGPTRTASTPFSLKKKTRQGLTMFPIHAPSLWRTDSCLPADECLHSDLEKAKSSSKCWGYRVNAMILLWL